jgi:hypothetical protein
MHHVPEQTRDQKSKLHQLVVGKVHVSFCTSGGTSLHQTLGSCQNSPSQGIRGMLPIPVHMLSSWLATCASWPPLLQTRLLKCKKMSSINCTSNLSSESSSPRTMERSNSSLHESIIHNHKPYTSSVKAKSLNTLQQRGGNDRAAARPACVAAGDPSGALFRDKVGPPSPSHAPGNAKSPNWIPYPPPAGRINRARVASALNFYKTFQQEGLQPPGHGWGRLGHSNKPNPSTLFQAKLI